MTTLISTKTSCQFNISEVNFISEDKIFQNTYLYENRMCKQSESNHLLGWKVRDWVMLIKSLIYPWVWRGAWGASYERFIRIGLSDQKVWANTQDPQKWYRCVRRWLFLEVPLLQGWSTLLASRAILETS